MRQHLPDHKIRGYLVPGALFPTDKEKFSFIKKVYFPQERDTRQDVCFAPKLTKAGFPNVLSMGGQRQVYYHICIFNSDMKKNIFA